MPIAKPWLFCIMEFAISNKIFFWEELPLDVMKNLQAYTKACPPSPNKKLLCALYSIQSVQEFIYNRKKLDLYHQSTKVFQHFTNFVTELFEPELKITAAVTIMTGAVLSLLANIVMLSLVAVLRRLQRPQNAFIIHQLIIDIVKSVHVILFAKVC